MPSIADEDISVIYASWRRRLLYDRRPKAARKAVVTKQEAERVLNETPLEQLPPLLQRLVAKRIQNQTPRGISSGSQPFKYGEMARRSFPKEFNQWYERTYVRERHGNVS